MRSTTTLVWTAALALTAAPAFAGDLQVPRQYATINDAAAAARPGDRIVVHGGRHAGVVIAKDGVTLVGRGATLYGNARVSASDVTVTGFRIRGENGCDAIVVEGDDTAFIRNQFVEFNNVNRPHVSLVVSGGDRARIENNRGTDIIVMNVNDAVIRRNRSRNESSGVLVYGDNATLEGNRIGGSISVDGTNAVVRGNRSLDIRGSALEGALIQNNVTPGTSTTGFGIFVAGNRIRVIGNRTTLSGISVEGDDAYVVSNKLNRSPSGLRVLGSGADVHDNVLHIVSYMEAYGYRPLRGSVLTPSISIVGSGNHITTNEVVHTGGTTGLGDGIQITGDSNVVAGNHLSAPTVDGIVVAGGSGNTLTGNVLHQPGASGVLVSAGATGTIVSDLTVSDGDIGLVNAGADTSVSDSTFAGNRVVDILDVAGFHLFDRNSFGILSHDTLLVPKR